MDTQHTQRWMVGSFAGQVKKREEDWGATVCGIREQFCGTVLFSVGVACALLGHIALEYLKQHGVNNWLLIPLECCHVVSTFLFAITSASLALVGCIYVIRRALSTLLPRRHGRNTDVDLSRIRDRAVGTLHTREPLRLGSGPVPDAA